MFIFFFVRSSSLLSDARATVLEKKFDKAALWHLKSFHNLLETFWNWKTQKNEDLRCHWIFYLKTSLWVGRSVSLLLSHFWFRNSPQSLLYAGWHYGQANLFPQCTSSATSLYGCPLQRCYLGLCLQIFVAICGFKVASLNAVTHFKY